MKYGHIQMAIFKISGNIFFADSTASDNGGDIMTLRHCIFSVIFILKKIEGP